LALRKEEHIDGKVVLAPALATIPRLQEMEKLKVDLDGTITIPSEIIEKRGLRPGDEVALIESAEGLLVYQGGLDEKTLEWWRRLDDQERELATAEACRYESLSEEARDAIWSEVANSIEN
jgi:AbrB family looped-hinge helix DNA binding protein